jgi:ABC-type molybdenum transport system ATPase subunit/photorepair protein PhrA
MLLLAVMVNLYVKNYSRPPGRWARHDRHDLHEHADPDLHKGEPLVEMDGVGKTYGAIRALEGINLTVNAGEVTCVLGDNGAGKSTLIKIISGLHPHNEGTLKVDGKPVHFGSPRESLDARHRHRLPGPRRRSA